MNCRYCGAPGQGKICEYCGRELINDPIPEKKEKKIIKEPQQIVQHVTNVYYVNDNMQGSGFSDRSRSVQQHSQNKPIRRDPRPVISPKNKDTALLLCFFLGFFGIHQFYTGHSKKGLLYLFTCGLCGIGWLIDIFVIATNNFKDGNGLPIKGHAKISKWVILIVFAFYLLAYIASRGS